MNNRSKIYTKTGDKGETSLIGGTRVPKYHIRIEAYGTVDELNSYLGLIRDQQINNHYKEILIEIQNKLFTVGSLLASEKPTGKSTAIRDEDIILLENEMDVMSEYLPELHSFLLPGGDTVVSYCHIARCICRRAERVSTLLAQDNSVDEIILKYLNRLSDYLFVLARKIAFDINAPETPLKTRI